MSLVLRSALLRASRRTAASEFVPTAILRDGRAKSAASSEPDRKMKASLFKGLNRKAPARRPAVEACEDSINRGLCAGWNPLPPHARASEPPILRALL